MIDENPELVAEISNRSIFIFLFLAAFSCFFLYIGFHKNTNGNSFLLAGVFGYIFLGVASLGAFSIWRNSILLYSDRLVIKLWFRKEPRIIWLNKITSVEEKIAKGRGGGYKFLTLYNESDPVYRFGEDIVGNYDEFKSRIIEIVKKQLPSAVIKSERPRKTSIQVWLLIIVVLLAIILLKLFLKTPWH